LAQGLKLPSRTTSEISSPKKRSRTAVDARRYFAGLIVGAVRAELNQRALIFAVAMKSLSFSPQHIRATNSLGKFKICFSCRDRSSVQHTEALERSIRPPVRLDSSWRALRVLCGLFEHGSARQPNCGGLGNGVSIQQLDDRTSGRKLPPLKRRLVICDFPRHRCPVQTKKGVLHSCHYGRLRKLIHDFSEF
jgi:hypothetical protein